MAGTKYAKMTGFLAPELVNGAPYLAPQGVPSLEVGMVAKTRSMVFLAPPLFNGLPYLAPQYVFVMPTTYGGGRARASRSSSRSAPTRAKSSAPAPSTRYHGRSDEQLRLLEAALLDDEEIVVSYLMELACV